MLEWAIIGILLNLLATIGLGFGILVVGVAALYLARFFTPSNVKKLMTAELPTFREIAGTVKLFGQEIAANAKLDLKRDQQLKLLERRLEYLENSMAAQSEVSRGILEELGLLESGGENGG